MINPSRNIDVRPGQRTCGTLGSVLASRPVGNRKTLEWRDGSCEKLPGLRRGLPVDVPLTQRSTRARYAPLLIHRRLHPAIVGAMRAQRRHRRGSARVRTIRSLFARPSTDCNNPPRVKTGSSPLTATNHDSAMTIASRSAQARGVQGQIRCPRPRPRSAMARTGWGTPSHSSAVIASQMRGPRTTRA